MSIKVFVPRDAAAVACGANAVAKALKAEAEKAGADVTIIRNGSRGMLWLEPLVEVESEGVRYGFGPVTAGDIPGLVLGGLFSAPAQVTGTLAIGPTEKHPYFARQTRLTFARCGLTDPVSLADYTVNDGYKGLEKALAMAPLDIVKEVTDSGLRGRGGAGFPTGIKWKTVHDAAGEQKYIVCNADEGDSGTFADRMIMEGDPFLLIEGMTIAGLAVGATRGYVYLRSEYPHAEIALNEAIRAAKAAGYLGQDIRGSGKAFELEVRIGAGAYVCGEETSLLESLEGKRGLVRAKPPLPAHVGLFGKPTVINNVLSLCAVPYVLAEGAKAYHDYGMGRSRGTMPVQLAGNLKHGGLFETAFGISLGELIDDIGGGTLSGRPVKAVQVGGPLGAYMPRTLFDTPFDYEEFTKVDALIGHAGVVVFDDTADMARMARFAFEFCAIESCGKCTPCRIGSTRGRETVEKIMAGIDVEKNIEVMKDLSETMKFGSLCALGGFTPYPVMSAFTHFPEDFRRVQQLQAAE
ncbi:NADP-reducing hydrogenase subunit HndC [Hartmannibacter diazotrophicus]|uniref:NADP-reducing hydrogenase subunit HndC n=1 Tax=Hartmannibacter diazotrophicus TaxID=1482074 RepID=A0A2C9D2T1_9HYPH|nr:NADH-ubiquinone oxidoreductase-F iron-sulfur binding region domain-containing protein [Hartmannibacter diazotrophicus]SON54499.1 NADP-reducing hydrogenase subunit HndC [Hartmannibacter diazotrophicus]